MGAPLALGILTWDDVLAGFSAPVFCTWVLRLSLVPVLYLGSVKMPS